MKRVASKLLRKRIAQSVKPYGEADLVSSAVVVTPHPDDETLGCGGTIIKKRSAGADVKVFVTTDGRNSHSALMDADALQEVRRKELVQACEVLGVSQSHLHLLDYEDGLLSLHVDAAADQLAEFLTEHQPDEVFLPFAEDRHPDHEATNRIATAAVERAAIGEVTLYEYPVWIWRHWPWVTVYDGLARSTAALAKLSVKQQLGYRMVTDFSCGVDIRDVLPRKREALAAHVSQTTRYLDGADWVTLEDIADGDWLDCFFQPYELFRKTRHAG